MIRYGTILKLGTGAQKGMARVNFQELDVSPDKPSEGIESPWMPVMQGFALGAKAYRMPRIGTLVGCMMDEDWETGMVMGARYNTQDTPPDVPDKNDYLEYEDGTTISYDPETHQLTALAMGPVDLMAIGKIRAQSMEGLEFSGAGPVTVDAADDMQLSASGKVTISAYAGVTINAYGGATIVSDGEVSVTAPTLTLNGSLTLTGSFTHTGSYTQTGNSTHVGTITATGEITSGIIPLGTHLHLGVTAGVMVSGIPTV